MLERVRAAWSVLRSRRALDPPPYFGQLITRGGLLAAWGDGVSLDRLLAENRSWIAMGARAIAERVMGIELQVVRRVEERPGTVVEEILDDHPVRGIFDANPIFSRMMLMRLTSWWLTTVGQAYLLKVGDQQGVRVSELWPLPPDRVDLRWNARGLDGYIYRPVSGGEVPYTLDEVVRIWHPNPAAVFDSLGQLAPQAIGYDTSSFLDETMRTHFQHDATPKTVLTAQADAQLPEGPAKERFFEDWRARFNARVGSMRGLPPFLPPGFDLKEFSSATQFADVVQLLQHYRDRLLMALGVPRSILGDVVDANRAAAETNAYVFDRHTVKPHCDTIADALTRGLLAGEPDLLIRFAPFVADDKDFTLRQEGQDLGLKLRSVNEVREERGLDPAAWGEFPVGGFGDVPYTGEEREPPGLETAEELEEPESEEEPDDEEMMPMAAAHPGSVEMRADGRMDPRATREWQRQVQRERLYTPAMQRALLQVFGEQRRAVLALLDARARARIDAADLRALLELLADPVWQGQLLRVTGRVRSKAYLETARETYAELGLSANSFALTEQTLRHIETLGAEMVTHTNATTRSRLKRELEQAIEAGESIDAVKRRVSSVFKGRRANARTIARTEVLSTTQRAQLDSYRQSGVVNAKRWNTSRDEVVRDTHQVDGSGSPLDSQVREVGEVFTLGDGEPAQGPGVGGAGGRLSAGNSINCRCFLTPVVD